MAAAAAAAVASTNGEPPMSHRGADQGATANRGDSQDQPIVPASQGEGATTAGPSNYAGAPPPSSPPNPAPAAVLDAEGGRGVSHPSSLPRRSTSSALSGETLPAGGSPDPVEIATSPPPNPDRPRTRTSTSFSLKRAWTSASDGLSRLGIEFAQENNSNGKPSVVIKISKAAWWMVALHVVLAISGTFGFVTSIYSYYSDSQNNSTMQQILAAVTKHPSELDEKMRTWVDSGKNRTVEVVDHQAAEQARWDALHKIFEDCALDRSPSDTFDTCDRLREFFDRNSLPRPDNSPLAKRNVAKLDRIIRRTLPEPERTYFLPASEQKSISVKLVAPILLAILVIWATWGLIGHRLRKWTKTLTIKWSRFENLHRDEDLEELETPQPNEKASESVITSSVESGYPSSNAYLRSSQRPGPHMLAARGAADELGQLFNDDFRIDIDQLDKKEYGSILAAAARSGNLATVNCVLNRKPEINLSGGRYGTVLQAAAFSSNDKVVRRVLEVGASENSIGGFYGSAIHAAAERGDLSMLECLLDSSAVFEDALNVEGGNYGYPLIAASARGQRDSVKLLLRRGAQANKSDLAGTTALHHATAREDLDIMQLLLGEMDDINKISDTFGTALHTSCQNGKLEATKILLGAGADPSIQDSRSRIPLHQAAQCKSDLSDIVQVVLSHQPDLVDCSDMDGNTALHLASISGSAEVVRVLLRFHANTAAEDKFSAQPLFRAAGCGYPEIVYELLNTGKADPNAQESFGRTALHGPAETDEKADLHKFLLDAGADVNLVGNDKRTALHEACNKGRKRNVELLLARDDIKINEVDANQCTPLYLALCSSDGNEGYWQQCVCPGVVELLLDRPDIEVNKSDAIAVQEAARKGHLDFVEKMLAHGANVQTRGGKYGGVLQAAAMSGNVQLVNLLLEPQHRADVNLEGGQFGSALAAAAAFGHLEVMQRLLEAGANPCMFGIGQYGSPWQSIGQKVDPTLKSRNAYTWNSRIDQMRQLLQSYGGNEVRNEVKPAYADWRWNLSTAGWTWMPKGEM